MQHSAVCDKCTQDFPLIGSLFSAGTPR